METWSEQSDFLISGSQSGTLWVVLGSYDRGLLCEITALSRWLAPGRAIPNS
jgi:hypothetical protein